MSISAFAPHASPKELDVPIRLAPSPVSTAPSSAWRGFETPKHRPRARSTPLSKSKQNSAGRWDRYIPNRGALDMELCQHQLLSFENENAEHSPTEQQFLSSHTHKKNLRSVLLAASPSKKSQRRMLSCFESSWRCKPNPQGLFEFESRESLPVSSPKPTRSLPSSPFRILDAPDIVDDYYLNLLSWGQHNTLAVALAGSVYLWNGDSGSIEHLLSLERGDDYVTSLAWGSSNCIVVGTSCNTIQLWDGAKLQRIRTFGGHSGRVSSLSWKDSASFSSGSRDSKILHHDSRASRPSITFTGHDQEVCGLAWSPDGSTLASGGNENKLCLWDVAASSAVQHSPRVGLNEHNAAVKALSWCPFQRNVLASGGGTADRNIRFWNTSLGSCLKAVDTGSQVCALQWSDHYKELVSSHGFSDNQLCLWKYPSVTKVREFRGHSSRVLHMAKSPDGSTIVSASADETLRFWDIFGSAGTTSCSRLKKDKAANNTQRLSAGISIR